MNIKKTLFSQVAAIIFIAVMLAACTAPPAQLQKAAVTPDSAVVAPGEIQRVTLEESKAAFDNDEAIFLDVRAASSYAVSHIPGALSIPLAELESSMGELDPNQWIITYCT